MNRGPGWMPWMVSAPSMTAVTASPGMPNAMMVTREPPTLELLAASEAMMPSGVPVPKRSGCDENFFAWSYAMTFAALPPIAGSTPIRTPTNEVQSSITGRDRISQITFACETTSLGMMSSAAGSTDERPIFSTSPMICAKAKTPISTGRNGMPPSSQPMPKVKRGCPITGSLPMMVMTRPTAPDNKPLAMEAPVRPATIDSAKMKSEKYSHGPNASASDASGPVVPTRKMPPKRPPKNDAQMPSQSALPGSPLRDIG